MPAGLRAFIPVHCGNVVDIEGLDIVRPVDLVFNVGPHYPSRAFWPEGDVAAALVFKIVHFLFNTHWFHQMTGKRVRNFQNLAF